MTDNTQELDEIGVYKDADGSQHPDTVAMSIVYNLGDALHDQLRGKIEARDFVKARQATNDDFIDYATDLIQALVNQRIEEAMAKFHLKKGVKYDVKASDSVIVIAPTNQLKESTNDQL